MRKSDRFKAVFSILFVSALIGDVGTGALATVLPPVLAAILAILLSLYWGVIWSIGIYREKNEHRISAACAHSFAVTLATIAGFWLWYGKHIERIDSITVDRQMLALVAIAMAIGLWVEFRNEIPLFFRKFSKSKTAP